MNKSRKIKVASRGPKKSRHHEPPTRIEADRLERTNRPVESPSWFRLLSNLSSETTISTAAFDKVVSTALEMLQSDGGNQCPSLPTKSLVLQELRQTMDDQDILTKQKRLASVLEMLQGPIASPWNRAPSSLGLSTDQGNELQRLDFCALEAAALSEFERRGSSNSVQPLHNSMSARSSLTREIAPVNTDPRELDSLLVGLRKHPTLNQLPRHELDPRATDLNNFIYGFTPFLKPTECPQGGLEIPPISLTGAQTPVGIFPEGNCTETSCFIALPPHLPAARNVPRNSTFPWNDSTLPAPDISHSINKIMDFTVGNPDAYIANSCSNFISTLDSRDAANWSAQRLQAMPLSIPSASQAISYQLTPPRISTDCQVSTLKTLNLVVPSPMDANQDRQGVHDNGVSVEEQREDKSMSLVVLTNAVLLSSGNRRCLVVPTDSQNAETAVNLTEADMEALISKGAAIPLSQVTVGGSDCLTRTDQCQGLDAGGAETGSLSGNDTSSQTPRSCFEASDGTPLPLNFTPIKGISDILGKPILNLGKLSAGTSPSVGSAQPFLNVERGARPNSQSLPSRHHQKEQSSTSNEKRKFLKCLIRSDETTQDRQKDIFSISGFVDTQIWSLLPAIVGVTSYDDIQNVLNWFGKNELVDLQLDRSKEETKGEENISRLYSKQLALMSYLPDFVMALVPTLKEDNSFDLKVFIKFHRS